MVFCMFYHGFTMVLPWFYHGFTMVLPSPVAVDVVTTGPSGDEQIRLPVALSKAVQRPFKGTAGLADANHEIKH